MRPLLGSAAVGIAASLIVIMAVAAGCGDRRAETRDDARPSGASSHRLPAHPPPHGPSYGRPGTGPAPPAQPDVRLLATLSEMARASSGARFILDDWRGIYHWWDCPYAPRSVPLMRLEHVGGTLRSRVTSGARHTHMNRRELKAKGYKPCPHCRPDLDAPARAPDTAYREPQRLLEDAPPSARRDACPNGGRHVPGARDINGRLRCERCGQRMD